MCARARACVYAWELHLGSRLQLHNYEYGCPSLREGFLRGGHSVCAVNASARV